MTDFGASPAEMFEQLDRAANTSDEKINGRLDAHIHAMWLATGEKTPDEIQDMQTGNLDPKYSTDDYIAGYRQAWASIYAEMGD